MTTQIPSFFGLLLDVDGPLASPVTRTIAIKSIIKNLITCAEHQIPVIFNTGRSDSFIEEQVVQPLQAAGLAHETYLYAICEKGAVWAEITGKGMKLLGVNEKCSVPEKIEKRIHTLVNKEYAEVMFFDDTKKAMVSVEQRPDTSLEEYQKHQIHFNHQVVKIFQHFNVGCVMEDKKYPDSQGNVEFLIEPTIISTDIQALTLGKEVGAAQGLKLISNHEKLPDTWYSVGDSRSDYAMADWLHEQGYTSIFVDVRPADGIPHKPYAIKTYEQLIHDEAGAQFLQECVKALGV